MTPLAISPQTSIHLLPCSWHTTPLPSLFPIFTIYHNNLYYLSGQPAMSKQPSKQKTLFKFSFFDHENRFRYDSSRQIELNLLDKDTTEHSHVHLLPSSSQNHPFNRADDPPQKEQVDAYSKAIGLYGKEMDGAFELIRLESGWLLLWNLLNFFVICYFFVESLFFMFIISKARDRDYVDSTYNQITKQIVSVILMIDFLAVRHRIRVVIEGRLSTSHGQVMHHYIKTYFLLDLISLIIILIDISKFNLGYFKLIFLVKVVTVVSINQQIFYNVLGQSFLTTLIKFIRMLFVIAFFTFIFACLFVTIDLHYLYEGGYYEQNGFLWITSSSSLNYINLYTHFEWYVWFEYALFMTVQMAVGCGYGQPTPLNPASIFLFNVACLTCKVVFAYFTKEVFDLFTKHYQKSGNMSLNISQLNTLNTKQEFSNPFREKVLSYLYKLQEHSVRAYNSEPSFSTMLSSAALSECHGFYKQHFLLGLTLFNSILDHQPSESSFRRQISSIVKGRLLSQNQLIIKRNHIGQQNLYLSELRMIKISNQAIGFSKYPEEWSFFGVREFFIDRRPLFDVQALRTGFVEYIRKEEFIEVIRRYQRVYEKYMQQIDHVKVGRGSTKSLDLNCWMCQGDHLSEDCRFVRDWRGSNLSDGQELQELHELQELRGVRESAAAIRRVYLRRTSSSSSSYSSSLPCKRVVLLKNLCIDSDRVHQSTGYLPAFNIVI